MKKLQGKVALITGSTSGIGLGIARRLAEEGADIALNGFGDPAEIEVIRSDLEEKTGVTVRYYSADLTNVAEIESMIVAVTEALGDVDMLVNSAGIQQVSPIEDFPVASWDRIIALNLTAVFHTVRLLIPSMKQKKWGRIINIASAHALIASPYKSAYVSAKHGVAGFTKTAALELAEHGITVNAICPGYVWTPLVEQQLSDTAVARGMSEDQVVNDVLLARQATKEFVTLEQVAAYASFLCGDEAASITGGLQSIDGGWTAS